MGMKRYRRGKKRGREGKGKGGEGDVCGDGINNLRGHCGVSV